MCKVVLNTLVLVAGGGLITWLIIQGYQYPWTGFAKETDSDGGGFPGKTLWDWLELLIVPTVLGVGAYLWEGARRRADQKIESDRQRQVTLDAYFNYVSELLLGGHISRTNSAIWAQDMIRTRTLAALRQLDGKRKSQVLQFLCESGLIYFQNPIVELNGADFSGSDLDGAALSGVDLRGVFFKNATIRNGNLNRSVLTGSDFSGADLFNADLSGANLEQARFDGANFKKAKLERATVEEGDIGKLKITKKQRQQVRLV